MAQPQRKLNVTTLANREKGEKAKRRKGEKAKRMTCARQNPSFRTAPDPLVNIISKSTVFLAALTAQF